jgi:hypothetical protein
LARRSAAFQAMPQGRGRHDESVSTDPLPRLTILPGTQLVLFLVELDQAATLLAWRVHRFLEGLKAASDLLGFVDLQREEDELEDLLHWSGNV